MNDAPRPASSSRLATVLVLCGLVLLVAFGWRVAHFENALRSGTVDLSSLSFTNSFTEVPGTVALPPASANASVERAGAPSLGSPNAPVQVVEFADFGCPFSRDESFVVRSLAQEFPTQVHFSYRYFPIPALHPQGEQAAEAAACADAQGKFWPYHDLLFINQADQSAAALLNYATQAGLNVNEFSACLSSGSMAAVVKADHDAGVAAGVVGTPTFFINGTEVPGAIPQSVFQQIIQQGSPSSS